MRKHADKINNARKQNGGRIIAVGTTSTRTLESVADERGWYNRSVQWLDTDIYLSGI